MKRIFILLALMPFLLSASAQSTNGVIGFATYADLGLHGVTGGGAGDIVIVDNRNDFDSAVAGDVPRTVILTKTILGDGVESCNDEVKVGSNKTIMAISPEVKINGINLVADGKQNIIIRNITLFNGKPDGLTFKNCHHVWIDHCDLSACDDGLLDFTLGSTYMTVSYCKIHDHNKVSLCNSGTQHYEDIGRQRVTYHHNYWYGGTQRNPRIGYGLGHVFNNYYEKISSYCIGYHSRAKVLSENNHFASTAKNPLQSMYSSDPNWVTYGEAQDRGSYVASGNIGTQQGDVFDPRDYYEYRFALEDASNLNGTIPNEAGPKEGLCDELILYPGNGAVNVTCNIVPMCLGYSDCELRIATNPDAEDFAIWNSDYLLQPSTTYYWYATCSVNGKPVQSPKYQFCTAALTASHPYPADGESHANLREAVAEKQFCGNMRLRWQPAFNASNYRVEIAPDLLTSDAEERREFVTTECSVDPGFLHHNTQYQWRVTPLDSNGLPLADAATWTFKSEIANIGLGVTNAESMTRSSGAFLQAYNAKADGESVKNLVVPDAGPAYVVATYNGKDNARAEFTVCFRNKEATTSYSGKSYFALYVNDQQVEWWQGHQATQNFYSRIIGKHVVLKKGDEIRVEFYTTVQSSNWTQLAWIAVDESDWKDEDPEPQEGNTTDSSYADPFAYSWWPNATEFRSPKPSDGEDYEIVYFPAHETSTKGIYVLDNGDEASWIDGRFHISNRSIYNPEKDDLRSTKTQAGIVCGEYGTMADGKNYPCVISMSVENTSRIRCYIAGSSSYKNRMKVTVIPVGDEGGQFVVYSNNSVGKNIPDYLDIDIDPVNKYRILFDGENPYAMFLGAVRLYTSNDPTGINGVIDSSIAPAKAAYNLSGQQVSAAYKGIVIKGGVKTISR